MCVFALLGGKPLFSALSAENPCFTHSWQKTLVFCNPKGWFPIVPVSGLSPFTQVKGMVRCGLTPLGLNTYSAENPRFLHSRRKTLVFRTRAGEWIAPALGAGGRMHAEG